MEEFRKEALDMLDAARERILSGEITGIALADCRGDGAFGTVYSSDPEADGAGTSLLAAVSHMAFRLNLDCLGDGSPLSDSSGEVAGE